MMTIVTHVEVKPGARGQWDQTMHERLRVAEGRPGWVGASCSAGRQASRSGDRRHLGEPDAWEAWHRDPTSARRESPGRSRARPAQEWWHEVLEERGAAA